MLQLNQYKTSSKCEEAINILRDLNINSEEVNETLRQLEVQLEQLRQAEATTPTPIYDTLVANYPYGDMPDDKKNCIEETVSELLENDEHANEPGLLLGKIQCGKTDTFEDIIGLAFDRGIDIAIILTKGTKALARQTIQRLNKDYRFFMQNDQIGHITINIYDIMAVWNKMRPATINNCKTVLVCKKEATNMQHLIDMFQTICPLLRDKQVLIVDDEADFASRNYRNTRHTGQNGINNDMDIEMARISQKIDDFRGIPTYCRYLQVTATPYCLYLQPEGELNINNQTIKPFRPRFTSIVPTHSAYIGGEQYFEESKNPDSMYSLLFHQLDQKCIDILRKRDRRRLTPKNKYGLTYAITSYLIATAIRRIQERTNRIDYKTSALIHVEITRKKHDWQAEIISGLIDDLKNVICHDATSDGSNLINSAIDSCYDDFKLSNQKGRKEGLIAVEFPTKDDVINEIKTIFNDENYVVQIVNSDNDVNNLLDQDTGELRLTTAANIFIGGAILDRGITIKHMLCFLYGRNPRVMQQDTVMQHARMYGARSKEDMAVTRLHTTAAIYRALVRMNELDNQLREWFLAGNNENDENAVFVGYDQNIRPCAPQRIKASNALILKPQRRIVPAGFWTGNNRQIHEKIEEIDTLIANAPHFNQKDDNGFFEMDFDRAKQILSLIEETFVYEDNDNIHNLERKNDIKEMLCAMTYCCSKSDNKIFILQRTDRDMKRLRIDGGYIDAPDDGNNDTRPSRQKAINSPVLMLIKQNGRKSIDNVTRENRGWNGTPFYWPVLMTQRNIAPVLFTLEQRRADDQ